MNEWENVVDELQLICGERMGIIMNEWELKELVLSTDRDIIVISFSLIINSMGV